MWTSDELRNILEAKHGENVIEAATRVKQENYLLRKMLEEFGISVLSENDVSDFDDDIKFS